MLFSALPDAQGLYDPENESDSCGVAMITDIQGRRSHAIVADGLVALEHLEHRGPRAPNPIAVTAPASSCSCPSNCFARSSTSTSRRRPPDGTNTFAAGICFLPQDPVARAAARERVEAIAADEGLIVLGWREVPVDPDGAEVGVTALSCMPYMSQLFVAAPEHNGGRPSGHRPRPPGLPAAQARRGGTCTSRRCPAGPWPTRAC